MILIYNFNICGFGFIGNECIFEIDEFRGVFFIVENLGLGLIVYVGEWLLVVIVLKVVNFLKLNRIGYGIIVVDNVDIFVELVE